MSFPSPYNSYMVGLSSSLDQQFRMISEVLVINTGGTARVGENPVSVPWVDNWACQLVTVFPLTLLPFFPLSPPSLD